MVASDHSESASRKRLPVCLGNGNLNRLVSLWDLVERFNADYCLGIIAAMIELENKSSMAAPRRSSPRPTS